MRDAGAGPEAERVVAAGVGVRTAVAVAGAAHVDDVRVVRAGSRSTSICSARADARHLVGEEDVGDGGELVEDVASRGVGEVEPEALLAPVGVLHEHRDLAAETGDAGRSETTRRIAAGDVLDLDHLRTPVGEDARRGGHEGVLGDLEDADAFHHVRHGAGSVRVGRPLVRRTDRTVGCFPTCKNGVSAQERGRRRGGDHARRPCSTAPTRSRSVRSRSRTPPPDRCGCGCTTAASATPTTPCWPAASVRARRSSGTRRLAWSTRWATVSTCSRWATTSCSRPSPRAAAATGARARSRPSASTRARPSRPRSSTARLVSHATARSCTAAWASAGSPSTRS